MTGFWKGNILQKHITRIEFVPLDEMTLEDCKLLDFDNCTPEQQDRIRDLLREGQLTGFWHNEYTDHKQDELPPSGVVRAVELVVAWTAINLWLNGLRPMPTEADLVPAPEESGRKVTFAEGAPRRQAGLTYQDARGTVDEQPGLHGGKKDYYFPAEDAGEKVPEDFYDAQVDND